MTWTHELIIDMLTKRILSMVLLIKCYVDKKGLFKFEIKNSLIKEIGYKWKTDLIGLNHLIMWCNFGLNLLI